MITLERQRKVSDLRSSFERPSTHSDSIMADTDEVPFMSNPTHAEENALDYFDNAIDEEEVGDGQGVAHSEVNSGIEHGYDSDSFPPPPPESVPSVYSDRPSSLYSERHSIPPPAANSPRESAIDLSPRNSSMHESIHAITPDTYQNDPFDSPRVSQVGSASEFHSSVENIQVTVTNHNSSTTHVVNEDLTPEPLPNSQFQIPPPQPEVTVTNNNTSKLDRQPLTSFENHKSPQTHQSDLYWKKILSKRERKLDRWQRSLVLGTGCALILVVLVIVVCVLVIVFVNAGSQEVKPVVTFQVLDGKTGRAGVISGVQLLKRDQVKWSQVGTGSTNEIGQIRNFGYTFDVGNFKIAFQNVNGNLTNVEFSINTGKQHVFVPIILNAKFNEKSKTAFGTFTGDGLP